MKKISDSQHRIREMLTVLGISQQDISDKTKIDKSTLSLYLSGKRTPRQDKISLISNAYNIDPSWLMGYDVPMKRENSGKSYSIDDFKKDACKLINAYPKEQRKSFLKQIDLITKNLSKKIPTSRLPGLTVAVKKPRRFLTPEIINDNPNRGIKRASQKLSKSKNTFRKKK